MCADRHARETHGGTTAHRGCPDDDRCPQCSTIAMERNRFFTGRYMSARDFRDEQAYFVSRHRLHNRLLHGWGVVCGLDVRPHRPECPGQVVVSCGIAIDCCGRELVLEESRVVSVWSPPDGPPDKPKTASKESDQASATERPTTLTYLLYLRYDEEEIECVPALFAEDCSPKRQEANRVRETVCIEVVPWDVEHQGDPEFAGCWQTEEHRQEPCSRGCGDEGASCESCLEPACACPAGVPLALITLSLVDDRWTVTSAGIDVHGRKSLASPTDQLTHIVDLNWKHGEVVPLSRLVAPDQMNGEVRVYFDRRLEQVNVTVDTVPPDGDDGETDDDAVPYGDGVDQANEYSGTGINRATMTVAAFDPSGDQFEVTPLFNDEHPPYWDPEHCAAVFTINEDWLEGRDTIAGDIVHVTLKCDFVLDCNGRAVDGDHLRGRLPTGDGIEGGTFESWFRVVDDRMDYGRRGGRGGRRRSVNTAAHEEAQS